MNLSLRSSLRLLWLAPLVAALHGCAPGAEPVQADADPRRPLRAVCTTTLVADLVRVIGGEHVVVESLMGPGVDPHLYKASEGDVRRLAGADVIFYHGLNLEGKMGELFARLRASRPVVAVAEAVDPARLRALPDHPGQYDPHIWFDVSLWREAAGAVAEALARHDPAHAAEYAARRTAYDAELAALDAEVRARLATIPRARRVLVTAHDAFAYFGARYDLEVVALQGVSTATEAGVADVKRLVDLVVERGIRAIFVETSVPERALRAVREAARARGHEVQVGEPLFSDALGDPDTPAGTYLGMLRHNVEAIVKGLQ